MTLADRSLRAGDRLVVEITNLGTTSIRYGEEFFLDRFQGGTWMLDPFTPDGFIMVGLGLSAGGMEVCRFLELPPDMAPGHYRYRKKFRFLNGEERERAVDFHVVP